MSYISAAALNRAAPPVTGAPATPIDAFTLPGDIPDAPGEASATDARALVPGAPSGPPQGMTLRESPSENWRARGLRHPAGRGWEAVAPARGEAPPAAEPEPSPEERRAFSRERQVAFLHALAGSGAVRPAAAAVGVSYRTAYRERRASKGFRLAWDAALLSARALHADVLASRAIDGVEEEVWYHGEVVATRRRYDARLLLAHLARLDKLTEDARTRAFADDYEDALERFAAGIDDPAPVCGDCGEALPLGAPAAPGGEGQEGPPAFSPGQCDKCDKPAPAPAAPAAPKAATEAPAPEPEAPEPCPDCGGRCRGPEEALTQADCRWYGNRLDRMEAARPPGARTLLEFPWIPEAEVEAEQLAAFEAGVERWWLVVPPGEGEDPERWTFDEED